MQKNETEPHLTPYTEINSKWIKDLNVRCETIKLLKENMDSKLLDIDLGSDFLNMTSQAKATKAKVNKWDYIKLKCFWTSLVAQWIRLCAPSAGGPSSIPGQGTRSHTHAATKGLHTTTKKPSCRD